MTDLVPLGEVVKIRYGYSFPASDFSDEGIPVIRMSDLQDYVVDTTNAARVPEHYWEKLAGYRIFKGDLIIGMSGSVGKLGIYNDDRPALQNQRVGVFVIKSPKEIDSDYLKYFAFTLEEKLLEISKGVAVKNVSAEEIESFRLPLPPLTEQKRIAFLLRRADRLRQLRRTARDLGDALLQSVFLEMFYNTESKWELSAVEDLAKKKNNAIRTGPFGSQLLHSEFTETGDVLVLGIDNAVQNEFSWGKPRYITTEKYQELKRYTVFPGDLIITIMATNGRVAVVPDNIPLAINTKHLCCITLDQKICLPKFLQACFLYHPDILKQMGGSERGAVMPGLNMEIIKNLVVPVPPLSLQEEFAGVVARVESLRGRMWESERQVEGLFESLLTQSFSSYV